MYIIAAFRNRNSAMKLYESLRSGGIRAEIINTPKETNAGCGLSVKTEECYMDKVRYYIGSLGLSAFAGFYSASDGSGRKKINRTGGF